jgi:large subunit ribosomal protein L35
MPKMKTKRAAAKRFRFTGSGKVRFKHAKMRHNLGKRRHKTKKRLVRDGVLEECDARAVRNLLPYG